MEFLRKVKSEDGSTVKYVLKTEDDLIVEFSAIDKQDGKNIICCPTQTMCAVGCKFCHTSDYIGKIVCRNLMTLEILEGVEYVFKDQQMGDKVLLISFMGCGEPILNTKNIVESMKEITNYYKTPYTRFAIATCIPYNISGFFEMTEQIKKHKLPVKLHLSLHYTIDSIRKEWMPNSIDILPALAAVDFYKKYTGNAVEIHYALIEGVNDTEQDAILLSTFLKDKDINVKFLFYNEKPTLNVHASTKDKLGIFRRYLDKYSISHEYYIPPGTSIGSSCGMFLMETYLQNGITPKGESN